MTDLQDALQAAYEADLAEGDNEMWQWVRDAQAEASADVVQSTRTRAGFDAWFTGGLTDDELMELAKEQLAALRLTQAEIAKRHNARQTPAKAVCGHNARDHSGLCCDDELCPHYVPF